MLNFLLTLPKRVLYAVLDFPARRTIVCNQTVPHMVGHLREILCDKGCVQLDRISDSVGLIIVHEALRRAAEKEKDGYPRYGEFCKQVEAAADSIIAVFNNEEDADPRIKGILAFNHVI